MDQLEAAHFLRRQGTLARHSAISALPNRFVAF
jgi:hypothetical protein